MPHNIALITTIVASFVLALILGLLANRFKLPPIVGYLIAGVMIGPGTPGYVADMELSGQLAEIGVILLMFGVGLHFSIKDLLAVRKIALPGAIVQIGVATALGMGLSYFWGWSIGASVVFGLALSVASTVVLIKALEKNGQLHTSNGQIAVGWLIVEDLMMVLVLVLLPALSNIFLSDATTSTDGSIGGVLFTLFISFGKITLFIALMLIVGKRVFPWLLSYAASTHSRELFTLCVIAVAIGIAFGSAKLFGVSFALGAFFAGMVMRESKLAHRAAEESLPFIDAFSVLFFVSIGMLFDPAVLIEHPIKVLSVVGIIVVGKSLAAFLLIIGFRYPLNTALTVSASLAQIGEFSFILAALGVSLGLLPAEGMSLILAGALISISINHFVFRLVDPLQHWFQSRSKASRTLEFSSDPLAQLPESVKTTEVTNHTVLIGYGDMGRKISLALSQKGIKFVVADENRELVEDLRKKDIRAVFGDVADENVLIQAHVTRAQVLVITIPDIIRTRQIIEISRILNPKVKIFVRTSSEEEAVNLKSKNIGDIFFADIELEKNMLDAIFSKIQTKE